MKIYLNLLQANCASTSEILIFRQKWNGLALTHSPLSSIDNDRNYLSLTTKIDLSNCELLVTFLAHILETISKSSQSQFIAHYASFMHEKMENKKKINIRVIVLCT